MPNWFDLSPRNRETLDVVVADLERQAAIYQAHDFHTYLGISKEMLKDVVLRLAQPQSANFRKRFDIPVVVFGNIPVEEQFDRAGIDTSDYRPTRKSADFDPRKYTTPEIPYLTWMQDGSSKFGIGGQEAKNVEQVRKILDRDERGATLYDGVGLVFTYPNIHSVLADHFIDLPGSGTSEYYPCITAYQGSYWRMRFFKVTESGWGSATCGK